MSLPLNRDSLHREAREETARVAPTPLDRGTRLGRGLGQLLGGARPHDTISNGQSDQPLATPAPTPINSGLQTLLRGSKQEQATASDSESDWTVSPVSVVVRATLIIADVVILVLLSFWFASRGQSFETTELLIAGAAVLVGAWLSCLACLLKW